MLLSSIIVIMICTSSLPMGLAGGSVEACEDRDRQPDEMGGLLRLFQHQHSQLDGDPQADTLVSRLVAWGAACANTRPTLGMDEAYLSILSNVTRDVILRYENGQCFGCPLREVMTIASGMNGTMKVQTKFSNRFSVSFTDPKLPACGYDRVLQQDGDYWITVNEHDGHPECNLVLINNPPNIYLPILYLFLLLVSLVIIYAILSRIYSLGGFNQLMSWRRSVDLTQIGESAVEMPNQNRSSVTDPNANKGKGTTVEEKPAVRKRLVSLDTFRGLSLMVMIFVNYGGGGYYFFEHVPWNGLAVADLVFPWFVFMMGTSIPLSFRGMMKRQTPRWRILYRVIKRTALLFLIGLSLNSRWYSYLSQLRIPGVLQRLALTYFLTALPHVFFARASHRTEGCQSVMGDITDYWPEWIINFGYLAAHLALTFALPVPGCPTGYIGPGGQHDDGRYFNCSGGAAGYIDRIVLTDSHIYQNPTFKTIYHGTQGYDPEGILGTLSSAFTCFLGLQAGKILLYHKSHSGRLVRWSVWALITGGIGMLLCKVSLNDGWIPINKNLWSVSFALVIAATGFTCLAIFYILTDLTQVWSGAPFLYPGLNSLVIYLSHDVFGTFFPIRWRVEAAHWSTLLMASWSTACWVILAFILYRKKIFVAL